jgi:ABC-2 type transport system ATP-binding protein
MGQRLGIASAMLGDPGTLILDEPVNGLDPEGVLWVRHLVRNLAAEGRTVFLSSHLMSEMAQTADQLLVIGRGRIITAGPLQEVIDSVSGVSVRVRSPQATDLARKASAAGIQVSAMEPGALEMRGTTSNAVGELAAQHRIVLHELTELSASLEETYMSLTHDAVEYRSESSQITSSIKETQS